MKNLPDSLYEEVSIIRYKTPHRFTFCNILKECESYVGLRESQRMSQDGRPPKNQNGLGHSPSSKVDINWSNPEAVALDKEGFKLKKTYSAFFPVN